MVVPVVLAVSGSIGLSYHLCQATTLGFRVSVFGSSLGVLAPQPVTFLLLAGKLPCCWLMPVRVSAAALIACGVRARVFPSAIFHDAGWLSPSVRVPAAPLTVVVAFAFRLRFHMLPRFGPVLWRCGVASAGSSELVTLARGLSYLLPSWGLFATSCGLFRCSVRCVLFSTGSFTLLARLLFLSTGLLADSVWCHCKFVASNLRQA